MENINRRVEYEVYKTKKAELEQLDDELRSRECTLREALMDDLWDAFGKTIPNSEPWMLTDRQLERDLVMDVMRRSDNIDDCLYRLRRAVKTGEIDGVTCSHVVLLAIQRVCALWSGEGGRR